MFPLGHLAFWDLSSPPLLDVCGAGVIATSKMGAKTMEWKFVIPGLFSTYALQSSTFLQRHVVRRDGVECPSYDQLLTYQPNQTTGTTCGAMPKNSLLVRTDAFGIVQAVHDIAYANGTMYNGSLTGVAVSVDHNCVWACGWAGGMWKIFRFVLADVLGGSSTISMANMANANLASAERCSLSFKPSVERDSTAHYDHELWVGSMVTEKNKLRGQAVAYTVKSDGAMNRQVQTIKYGAAVVGLSFFLNTFEEQHVAIARCAPLTWSVKGKKREPCRLEFHT